MFSARKNKQNYLHHHFFIVSFFVLSAGVPLCSTACLISSHPSGVPSCHSQSHGVTADFPLQRRQGDSAGVKCNATPAQQNTNSEQSPARGNRKNTALPLQGFPRIGRADFVICKVSLLIITTGLASLSAKPRHFRIVLRIRLLSDYSTSRTKRTARP